MLKTLLKLIIASFFIFTVSWTFQFGLLINITLLFFVIIFAFSGPRSTGKKSRVKNSDKKAKPHKQFADDVLFDQDVKPDKIVLDSWEQFDNTILSHYMRYPKGTVGYAPIEQGRYRGVFVILDAKLLEARRKASYQFGRNNMTRRYAKVPGYSSVSKDLAKDGTSLWHRTHFVPYRYALSEGGMGDAIMFTGTAHLNHGDRPDKHFEVDKSGQKKRTDYLYNLYKRGRLRLITEKDISVRGTKKGTHFSLDDLEQVSDHIINANPKDVFMYAGIAEYEKKSVIPTSVVIRLVNLTKHQVVMAVRLPNVK